MGIAANLNAILGESCSFKEYHIKDASDRPSIPHDGFNADSDAIPVLNLGRVRASSGHDRKQLLDELRDAGSKWGFMQVLEHGVDDDLVNSTLAWAREFFGMSLDTKLKAKVNPPAGSPAGYMCGLVNSKKSWQESFHSWADPDDFKVAADKLWPPHESRSKEIKEMHCKFSVAMEELALEILQLLEEALGASSGEFTRQWERLKRTFVRFNWYPPCDEPELVLGARSHTDPGIITILLEDDVGGLQILKDSKWIACKPTSGSFVVNVGDCLQVLSNDLLPSIQHRALVNKHTPRLSVASFVFPKSDARIEPSSDLVDEQHPAAFKPFVFEKLTDAAKETSYKGKEVLSRFRS